MGHADYYKAGDYNVICDRCGFKFKRSECAKEWNGVLVCLKRCWEPRHPQDFVGRGNVGGERQSVPLGRPEGEDYFLTTNEVSSEDL